MLDNLRIQNPWWRTGKVPEPMLGNIARRDFGKLVEGLDRKEIMALIGPRRSGKTTLLHSVVAHLLKKGASADRILYMSCDNPKIRISVETGFDELFADYVTSVIREPMDSLSSKIYVLLDELYKVRDWGNVIKYWQDLNLPIKFLISGSSTSRILKGSGESLLGRIRFYTILPLVFTEYLGIEEKRVIFDHEALSERYLDMLPGKDRILVALEEYMLKGGYPEIFQVSNPDEAYEILRLYKTLAVTRDIIDMRKIKQPRMLGDIVDLLADTITTPVNYSNFADVLKIKSDTVKKYISYLEESFLISTVYAFSKSRVTSTRKDKKIYFMDHGLRNSLLLTEIDESEKSRIIENVVFFHLYHMKKTDLFPKIFYWRRHYEVDFVINIEKRFYPLEVKYRKNVTPGSLKGLLSFMDRYGLHEGIVITRDQFEERTFGEKRIGFVPAWLFLVSV